MKKQDSVKRLDAAIMYALGSARLHQLEAFRPLVRQKIDALVKQDLLLAPDYDARVSLSALGLPDLPEKINPGQINHLPMPRNIIGLSGDIGAGKDATAGILVDYLGFERFAFGDDIKFASAALYGVPLESLIDPEAKNAFHPQVGNTLRNLMRHIGSEVFRAIDEKIWITGLETKMRLSKATNAVLSDLRLETEFDFIKTHHGVHWRVVRDQNPYVSNMSQHSTDVGFSGAAVDHVVPNHGDLRALHAHLDQKIFDTRSIVCKVVVSGTPSDEEDEDVPGEYAIDVFLDQPVFCTALLSEEDRCSIACAALDSFHTHIGIEELEDFEINVYLPDGTLIVEVDQENVWSNILKGSSSETVVSADFLGKVDPEFVQRTRPGF